MHVDMKVNLHVEMQGGDTKKKKKNEKILKTQIITKAEENQNWEGEGLRSCSRY